MQFPLRLALNARQYWLNSLGRSVRVESENSHIRWVVEGCSSVSICCLLFDVELESCANDRQVTQERSAWMKIRNSNIIKLHKMIFEFFPLLHHLSISHENSSFPQAIVMNFFTLAQLSSLEICGICSCKMMKGITWVEMWKIFSSDQQHRLSAHDKH